VKVLHVNEHLARKGGVETYLLSLLPMLAAHGITSTVAYGTGDPAEYTPSVCVPGIRHTGFRSQGAARQAMQAALDQAQPDVIHVHNVQNVGVLQACLAYGTTVMTAHDYRSICPSMTLFYKRTQEVCQRTCGPGCFTTTMTKHCLTPRPQYAGYFYYRSRWTTAHADRFALVIAPSGGARDRLQQAGFEGARISVLPYFCSFAPRRAPRTLPASTTITFMGRIAPTKGYEYFIEALGQLPGHVQGIMVGNFTDGVAEHVRQMARQHGCQDRLVLRAWASPEEVVEIMDQTTVFVFPSLWPETLGIVGLEALSRGVPVVASDVGGVREWLRDGENGILVQPKSARQIRDAVLELTACARTLTAFGERGLETIRERFSPSCHTHRLIDLYAGVTQNN